VIVVGIDSFPIPMERVSIKEDITGDQWRSIEKPTTGVAKGRERFMEKLKIVEKRKVESNL